MAKLTILGRSFEIAPYSIGAMKRAAPHIDAINQIYREDATRTEKLLADVETLPVEQQQAAVDELAERASIANMLAPVDHVIAIVAIGLQKIDPTMTAEYIAEEVGYDELPALNTAMAEILRESGLAPQGEASAPSKPAEAEGASPINSETSSAS